MLSFVPAGECVLRIGVALPSDQKIRSVTHVRPGAPLGRLRSPGRRVAILFSRIRLAAVGHRDTFIEPLP